MSPDGSFSGSSEPRRFTYQIDDQETVIEGILEAVGTVIDTPVGPHVHEARSVQEARDHPPPLYEAVDLDALLALSSDPSVDGDSWRVTFSYCGCGVTVTSDDTVVVEERSSAAEDE